MVGLHRVLARTFAVVLLSAGLHPPTDAQDTAPTQVKEPHAGGLSLPLTVGATGPIFAANLEVNF